MSDLIFDLQPRQMEAFRSPATEILYGGAAGGGKSHLLRVASILWCAEIPHLQIYLFRRKYPELASNHLEGPTGYPALLNDWVKDRKVRINYSKNEINFTNGATIHLRHCQHDKDIYNYQGAEIHVLMLDEATHFTPEMYKFLRSRCRLGQLKLPQKYIGKFPKILAGTNPGGISHNWFKDQFIDMQVPFEIVRMERDAGGMLRQFIPALLADNFLLKSNDPEYENKLYGLGNKALVKAMLLGDWNIVSGGAFDDVWSTEEHIIEPFNIPHSWYIDRSFDWGSAKPFSVIWWAEADGTEADLGNGRVWCPPRDTLIAISEWYGCGAEPDTGLRMSAENIGKGIKEREIVIGNKYLNWCEKEQEKMVIRPGPADNQIFSEMDENCIADNMKKQGIYWSKSNKSPGTRIGGLELMRARLQNGLQDAVESPALYFFDNCRNLIKHLPTLPRDPRNVEDVDTNVEDHDYDSARYRVLGSVERPSNFKMEWMT